MLLWYAIWSETRSVENDENIEQGRTTMTLLDVAEIGTTGLKVTRLGLGGAGLGGLYSDVSLNQARETVHRSFLLGSRYFDTAPLYGLGKSEEYLGHGLMGLERDKFVVSTKVGRVLDPADSPRTEGSFVNPLQMNPVFDYSNDGIMRSVEDSLRRLKLDFLDIVLMHDPDGGIAPHVMQSKSEPVHFKQAMNEAYPKLHELRSQGVIKTIGVGMNQWQGLVSFAHAADFDCFLLAGRYTLLDQSALSTLLPICEDKEISVILGGPYNSGILASDLSNDTTYFYEKTPADVLERARAIKEICDRHKVPLKAAALQMGLAHPAVASTIPGGRSVQEIDENVQMVKYEIPHQFWTELKSSGFLHKETPLPSTDE